MRKFANSVIAPSFMKKKTAKKENTTPLHMQDSLEYYDDSEIEQEAKNLLKVQQTTQSDSSMAQIKQMRQTQQIQQSNQRTLNKLGIDNDNTTSQSQHLNQQINIDEDLKLPESVFLKKNIQKQSQIQLDDLEELKQQVQYQRTMSYLKHNQLTEQSIDQIQQSNIELPLQQSYYRSDALTNSQIEDLKNELMSQKTTTSLQYDSEILKLNQQNEELQKRKQAIQNKYQQRNKPVPRQLPETKMNLQQILQDQKQHQSDTIKEPCVKRTNTMERLKQLELMVSQNDLTKLDEKPVNSTQDMVLQDEKKPIKTKTKEELNQLSQGELECTINLLSKQQESYEKAVNKNLKTVYDTLEGISYNIVQKKFEQNLTFYDVISEKYFNSQQIIQQQFEQAENIFNNIQIIN